MSPQPEPWLRGPVAGIPAPLQPVAHALVAALEDVSAAVSGMDPSRLWARPGGAASIGFHVLHLAGSTDRLFTYARGESLSDAQKAALALERGLPEPHPSADSVLATLRDAIDRALRQLAETPDHELSAPRAVGRDRLPSNVLGLLFHAAEHAQRHVGQIVTTAKILGGAPAPV